MSSATNRKKPALRRSILAVSGVWTVACVALAFLVSLILVIILPGLERRRSAASRLTRLAFAAGGLPIRVDGLQHMPDLPCVVVANHASYLDGLILFATLPARFAFVIKKEVTSVPLVSLLLRRIGSEFVERFDSHRGASDARRLLGLARRGESLAFFPEGTFVRRPGLGRFRTGAFAAASKAGIPVLPVVIRGSRRALPEGRWLPVPGRLEVEVFEPLVPADGSREECLRLRGISRAVILAALGEPDLAPDTTSRDRASIAAGGGQLFPD